MLVHCTPGDDIRFKEICGRNGWKRTAQRRAVFDCLCGNRNHPSVEMVWKSVRERLPDISLDSVYRILDDFAAAGLIRRLSGKTFRYDADTGQHQHFVCSECGGYIDFNYDPTAKVIKACEDIGEVMRVEVNVHGICESCGDRISV